MLSAAPKVVSEFRERLIGHGN